MNTLKTRIVQAGTWLTDDPRRIQMLFLLIAVLVAIVVAAFAGLNPAVKLITGLAGGGQGGSG